MNFLKTIDVDIAIAGGTLGIILATALQLRGLQVAAIERGELKGRVQEWNISRAELAVLVELELLSEAELAIAIASEYNPAADCVAADARYLGARCIEYWRRSSILTGYSQSKVSGTWGQIARIYTLRSSDNSSQWGWKLMLELGN